MLIPPSASPQESQGAKRRPGSSSAQAMPRGGTNANLPTLRAARQQQMLKTPSQPVPAVHPEQKGTAAPNNYTTNTPARPAQANTPNVPAQANTPATVKPFIASATVNEQIQVPANQPAPTSTSHQPDTTARKLFISGAIIVVALIIVMLLLLVFLRGKHFIGSNASSQYVLFTTRNMLERYLPT